MMIPIKDSYSFSEIIEAQSKNLDEKIEYAISILQSAFKMSLHNIALAFSGGKDSTVVADLIERFLPEQHERTFCIFGNTGVEFPESLKFARKYGKAHFDQRFFETEPLRLEKPELRYDFAKKLVSELEAEGALGEILKSDGKLKGQNALICAAKKRGYELNKDNCFPAGKKMDFRYCLEQYGAPLLGKSASKLDAHRINIECFLKYSNTESDSDELKEYYDTLRECKYSQHCCTLLKKEPSEELQKKLKCDVIIKGLMAAESHTRMVSIATRGSIFKSSRSHIKGSPFYHVSPIAMWTDADIWEYIHRYDVEYSPLYDITYIDKNGNEKHIERNGCMFCGTDIQFPNNHLAVLRQTHPKAYKVCMESFGYQKELFKLFEMKKNPNILSAASNIGKTARIVDAVGNEKELFKYRPCAYDDFSEMVDLAGTGIDSEYDPEEEIQ